MYTLLHILKIRLQSISCLNLGVHINAKKNIHKVEEGWHEHGAHVCTRFANNYAEDGLRTDMLFRSTMSIYT